MCAGATLTLTGAASNATSYLWTGLFMGPVGGIFDYNGGTIEIHSCTPINSFEVLGSGMYNGVSDSHKSIECDWVFLGRTG